jgi:hypothetical protein
MPAPGPAAASSLSISPSYLESSLQESDARQYQAAAAPRTARNPGAWGPGFFREELAL